MNIVKTRSFPGADGGSDHDLVMMSCAFRLTKKTKHISIRIRFNIKKLTVLDAFRANLKGASKRTTAKRSIKLQKISQTHNRPLTTTIQNKKEKCFAEERDIMKKWTEYCSELFSHKASVDEAVKSLELGKSAGVDNIPSESVNVGREPAIDVLHQICNNIWKT
ncbi:coiled-coil domain-containing protein 83-like [Plakobranchus ocellatus]|uniref:Coiled-coil domain-containing protein 83-like n=1 Tax=Plakobranchus ocellatus TaxID=259542 RepID=A0AAV4CNG6_9GAST|nr:coiled-coil domain-containing protein 83-like [Plakobranchus ocellatus]